MLSVDVPRKDKKAMLERYLTQRYRLDNQKGYRTIPEIDKQAVRIEQEVRELEEQLRMPRKRLDRIYLDSKPAQAGQKATYDLIHKRCESCKHYYANIPEQARLVKRATQMCLEYDGISKETILLLRAEAKPCPQGIWDVFVVNQKKDEYELVVGTRFLGPEICPDFEEKRK